MSQIDERTGAGPDDTAGIDPFVQLAFVHAALDDYALSDLGQLPDDWFEHLIGSIESLRTRIETIHTTIVAEADRRGHGRARGYFTAKNYLTHHANTAGPEARARIRVHRLLDQHPHWGDCQTSGVTDLAHCWCW